MSFAPDDFVIPNHVRTDEFEMRLLRMVDFAEDFDAYMSSIDHLKGLFDLSRSLGSTRNLNMPAALAGLVSSRWHHYYRKSFSYACLRSTTRVSLAVSTARRQPNRMVEQSF